MGMHPDEIVSGHPSITLSEVHAALAYYYENRERIDADIQEGERFVAALKAQAASSPLRKTSGKGTPMPRTIRFHLDENCHRAVAEGLRRRGIDVTGTPEAGLQSATDDEQIAHALAQGVSFYPRPRLPSPPCSGN